LEGGKDAGDGFLIEIRWHGRGGQGAVTAAEILAHAAINQGWYAQASPSFGPERRGAPVLAFNRLDKEPIGIRSEVYEPDVVIVIDPNLLWMVNVLDGLKNGGALIINTRKSLNEIRGELGVNCRLAVIDARKIALEILRVPIVNTTMLGAAVRVIGLVDLHYVLDSVRERFGKAGDVNAKAVTRGFNEVTIGEQVE
jgi:2-oxoacid:acceptor oxidoreductase gamma subunit (pyruvate/2-ketoisovalerate family)